VQFFLSFPCNSAARLVQFPSLSLPPASQPRVRCLSSFPFSFSFLLRPPRGRESSAARAPLGFYVTRIGFRHLPGLPSPSCQGCVLPTHAAALRQPDHVPEANSPCDFLCVCVCLHRSVRLHVCIPLGLQALVLYAKTSRQRNTCESHTHTHINRQTDRQLDFHARVQGLADVHRAAPFPAQSNQWDSSSDSASSSREQPGYCSLRVSSKSRYLVVSLEFRSVARKKARLCRRRLLHQHLSCAFFCAESLGQQSAAPKKGFDRRGEASREIMNAGAMAASTARGATSAVFE
jgi:hypothetical protein